jgi:drug/metabolite transporter (DMT)-like permease
VANVQQMRAARRVDAPERVSATLLARLLHEREWWVGLGASIAAYFLQAAALYLAPVVLVQPLIVTELLFALPLAAAASGRRLGLREWTAAAAVGAGIAVFLLLGQPSGGSDRMALGTTITTAVAVAVGVGVLVAVSECLHRRPMARASLLAVAASVCFGMLSVMTKVASHQFQHDRLGALLHVQPYLLAVAALTGLLLAQTAFRIAPLSIALPLIDIGEPLVASVIAVGALHENLDFGQTAAGVAVSIAVLIAGVALLDTSPLVRATQADINRQVAQGAVKPPRERQLAEPGTTQQS